MPIERIPVVASVDPEANTDVYYESGELSVNTMYDKYSQDRFYATQRPSLKVLASDRSQEVSLSFDGFVQRDNNYGTTEVGGSYYDGTYYIAVGGSGSVEPIEYSTDATTWTKASTSGSATPARGITKGASFYLAIGGSAGTDTLQYWKTEDVTATWTQAGILGGSTGEGEKVHYADGTFVVVGTNGMIATTDDTEVQGSGNIFLFRTTPFGSTTVRDVTFFDGDWYFVGDEGKAYKTTDFSTYTEISTDFSGTETIWRIDHNSATLAISGDNGKIQVSTNGTSWTSVTSGLSGDVRAIEWIGLNILAGDSTGDLKLSDSSYTEWEDIDSSFGSSGLYAALWNGDDVTVLTGEDGKIASSATILGTEGGIETGRGLYHWEKTQQSYIVIDNIIYVDSNSLLGTISGGIEKVFFVETDDYLVILDPENNEGWTINEANVVEKITDEDFPPNFATPEQLAGGGAWVDGFLFIITEEGFVWNSVINDPRSWNALNFIGADRLSDAGVYLSRHAEGLVAIGTRSTEFFYNAGLETGSPLSRRQDLSYYVGCPNRNYVFNTGETVYFIGNEEVGTLGAFTINKYQLEKVSNRTIDTLLTTSFNDKGVDFLVTGAMITNHLLFFVSALIKGSEDYTAEYSLVFDVFADKWTRYETGILDRGHFPIVGFAGRLRDRTTNTVVLFVNAEYGQMTLDYTVQDFLEGGPYFAEGVDYIEDQEDYVQTLEGDDAVVPFTIRLGEVDFDTMTNKFVYRTEVVGTTLADSQGLDPIQVRWSDDHYNTFTEYRNLDTSFRSKLTRCGKFRRRAHEIHYEGVEPLRIEGIELYLRGSSYA